MRRPHILAFKLAKDRARELRRNSTDSEKLLWERLRNRQLGGYKFLRQHPVIYRSFINRSDYFIADFYCDVKKVVVEMDGLIHEDSKEYDQFRDEEMEIGIHILRIKNEEIINMKDALNKILTYLDSV
jgi:very-short-patch-repair endonuclease